MKETRQAQNKNKRNITIAIIIITHNTKKLEQDCLGRYLNPVPQLLPVHTKHPLHTCIRTSTHTDI